ncbi:MAG: YoaK family protein [Verrucomicrobiota bacterium]
MLSKPIPLWIYAGGAALAALAGSVNAVGFLSVHHQALTHMSGTVTLIGIGLAHGDRAALQHALLVLLFFFLGCVVSGLIIRQSTLRAGRRYGFALSCEAGLLFGAGYLFRHHSFAGAYLATMACGLQNAMANSYSGAVIRTTHITGIVTDLGIAVGLAARRERVDWRRMRLYGILLAGFFTGGALGALGFSRWSHDTILIPAAGAAIIGVSYTIFKHAERQRQQTPPTRPLP